MFLTCPNITLFPAGLEPVCGQFVFITQCSVCEWSGCVLDHWGISWCGGCGCCVFVDGPWGPAIYPYCAAWDLRVSVVCFFASIETACLQNLFPLSHTGLSGGSKTVYLSIYLSVCHISICLSFYLLFYCCCCIMELSVEIVMWSQHSCPMTYCW